jgi:truncated hemoglobin YjbI
VQARGQTLRDRREMRVFDFKPGKRKRNVILFIHDAIGANYRGAGHIMARSVATRPGVRGLRERYFDRWLERDEMTWEVIEVLAGLRGDQPFVCRWRARRPRSSRIRITRRERFGN